MPQRLVGSHKHRQSRAKVDYDVTYVVDGRAITWRAQVTRNGRHTHLCGGGLELPEEDAGTGLGMSAVEIVRQDVSRAIDGME